MVREHRIEHGPVPAGAERIERTAVRAVAVRDGSALLLRGSHYGDLRFPGGGVDPGEDVESALRRELREECGAGLRAVGEHLVTVVDERPAREPGCVFAHVSHYWSVEVDDELGAVEHDLRERGLGLETMWVPVPDALATNRAVRSGRRDEGYRRRTDTAEEPDPLAWIERETYVLELISAGALPLPG
ncbi:MAG: NUDIX hydrolase [Candidatus Nanopelagicales bacterium]